MLVTGGTHAGEFLRLLGNGHEWGIERLFYAYQERPGGIAEALGLAEQFVGRRPVVVMLADNVFEARSADGRELRGPGEGSADPVSRELRIPSHLRHLGVPELDGDGSRRDRREARRPPSELRRDRASTSTTPTSSRSSGTLEPSGRGELEITDVNNWYVERGDDAVRRYSRFWGDAGESIEAYYAVNDFVRRNGANQRDGRRRAHPAALLRGRARLVPRGPARQPVAEARPCRRTSRSRAGASSAACTTTSAARTTSSPASPGWRASSCSTAMTGERFTEDIGEENPVAVYIPGHLAHGFEALDGPPLLSTT